MGGRPVPSQLDQVLPRFSVQEPGPYHPFGRIRIAPFGKGVLRILGESGYTINCWLPLTDTSNRSPEAVSVSGLFSISNHRRDVGCWHKASFAATHHFVASWSNNG